MGLYFEDYQKGGEWTTVGRTIGESDLSLFAGLTGDMHPLHTDAQYCRTTRFGERIAHGFLVASIASGLAYRLQLSDDTVIANLGTQWKFTSPVRIGDTIHVVISVKEARPSSSNPGAGVVTRRYEVRNQRNEVCAVGEVSLLVRRREAAAGTAA